MGGGGGGKSRPKTVAMPVVAAPAKAETVQEAETASVHAANNKAKKAAAAAAGRQSTILTGALGDASQAQVKRKTMLGQ